MISSKPAFGHLNKHKLEKTKIVRFIKKSFVIYPIEVKINGLLVKSYEALKRIGLFNLEEI
jgi:hypothetical protein